MAFFSILAKLTGDTADFDRKMNRSMSRAKSTVASAASAIKGQLAAAFGAGAIIALERRTIQFGSRMQDMADRFGTTTTEIQKLTFAAEQGGASIEGLVTALARLGKIRVDLLRGKTAEGADELFKQAGISVDDIGQMSLYQNMMRLLNSNVLSANNAQRTGNAQILFGESGGQLLPAIDAGMGRLAERLQEIGGVIGEGDIRNLKEASDAIEDLKRQMLALGAEAAPWLSGVLKATRDVVASGKDTGGSLSGGLGGLNFSSASGFVASVAGIIEQGVGRRAAMRAGGIAGRALGGGLRDFAGGIGGGGAGDTVGGALGFPGVGGAAFAALNNFNLLGLGGKSTFQRMSLNAGGLSSIGGFLGGAGGGRAIIDIEKKQLVTLKNIEQAIKKSSNAGETYPSA